MTKTYFFTFIFQTSISHDFENLKIGIQVANIHVFDF